MYSLLKFANKSVRSQLGFSYHVKYEDQIFRPRSQKENPLPRSRRKKLATDVFDHCMALKMHKAVKILLPVLPRSAPGQPCFAAPGEEQNHFPALSFS